MRRFFASPKPRISHTAGCGLTNGSIAGFGRPLYSGHCPRNTGEKSFLHERGTGGENANSQPGAEVQVVRRQTASRERGRSHQSRRAGRPGFIRCTKRPRGGDRSWATAVPFDSSRHWRPLHRDVGALTPLASFPEFVASRLPGQTAYHKMSYIWFFGSEFQGFCASFLDSGHSRPMDPIGQLWYLNCQLLRRGGRSVLQKAKDDTVLRLFSILFNLAVRLLKQRQ